MKLEREVIIDLLPAYFSGESSAATRTLVEDYFRENPEFEAAARRSNHPLEGLKALSAAAGDAREKLALERARQITETRSAFLWLAVCFTLLLLLFRVHDHRLIWIMWDKSPVVGVFFTCMSAFFWLLYLSVRRSKEPMRSQTKFLWLAGFYTVLLFLPTFHDHRVTLLLFSPDADVTVVFAVIAVVLWISFFYLRWKAKRARL
ncbi:MAG TPA: hypothetical protein VI488_21725 [Candidatus Angelobacter sp.]